MVTLNTVPLLYPVLNQLIVNVNYAADDQHVIAVVSRGEGDLWLAEGEFP